MNDKVLACARALADALVSSEEYTAMQEAEAETLRDPALIELFALYSEKNEAIRDLTAANEPDPELVSAAARELEELKERVRAVPATVALHEARAKYSELVRAVNREIERAARGDDGQAGCSGDCTGCSGCSGH